MSLVLEEDLYDALRSVGDLAGCTVDMVARVILALRIKRELGKEAER